MDSVCSNCNVCRYGGPVREAYAHTLGRLVDAFATHAKLNRIRRDAPNAGCEHLMKVVAVDGDVGKAVACDGLRTKVEELPGLPGIPQPDFLATRLASHGHDRLLEPQRKQDARAVGADLNARADLPQFRGLLKDGDLKPLPQQREGCSQAANSSSDDGDLHIR